MPQQQSIRLFERAYASSLRVDEEAGVIRGVKVLSRESRNNRVYTDAAIADAARLYEGVDVNLDHERTGKERGVLDRIGTLSNVRIERDGVYADLQYLKAHPSAGLLVESATRFAQKLGLSHHAEGTGKFQGGKQLIENINAVRSVDLVTKPATTNGLFEEYGDMAGQEMLSFMQAISQVVNDPETTVEAKLDKIRAILEAKQQVADALSADGEAEPEEEKEAKPMAESVATTEPSKELLDLREQLSQESTKRQAAETALAQAKDREAVLTLFESAGVKPDVLKLAAVTALQGDDRVKLIESWKSVVTETVQPPRSASRLRLFESSGEDRYEEGKLIEHLTGRKVVSK